MVPPRRVDHAEAPRPEEPSGSLGASDVTAVGPVGRRESANLDGRPSPIGQTDATPTDTLANPNGPANPDGRTKSTGATDTNPSDIRARVAGASLEISGTEAVTREPMTVPTPAPSTSGGQATNPADTSLFRAPAPVLDVAAVKRLEAACAAAGTIISRVFSSTASEMHTPRTTASDVSSTICDTPQPRREKRGR